MDTIKGGHKTKFKWTKNAETGFEKLKHEVATQPILGYLALTNSL